MSLRAALALSLKDAESQKQKDTGGEKVALQSNTSKSTPTPNKKKKQSTTPSSSNSSKASSRSRINIEIPHQKLTKCIRNQNPSQIDTHGFVELSNILPSQLLTNIKNHAITKMNNDSDIEIISNALQIDLSKELFNEMKVSLVKNEIVEETMKFVYGQPPPAISEGDVTSSTSSEGKGGAAEQKKPTTSNYNGYIVETPKILVALPGSAPQLPHADDHCSSCIICLLHLSDGQEPTRVATYDKMKDYPTGITVTCDKCNRHEMLPDHDYRRGVHLTDESWSCNCKEPWQQYDFEGKLVTAFSELLERGAPDLCDSYCGKEDTKMGDGYLALPTLIHRGPGNASSSAEPRYMLFFTLRPQYANTTSSAAHYHKYNPDLQIHAATVLFNQFNKVKKVYAGSGCDVAGRFGTIVSRDCSKILGENEVLSEENASMRAILEDMNVAVPAPKKLSSPAATTSSKKKRKEKDENEELAYEPVEITHNDSCEVCGTGGDLICCSTCNLVFHLGCTRPQLTEVPEGNWNCAYCVAENLPELEVTPQALEEAKRSVEEMDAEKAEHKPLRGKQAKRQKLNKLKELLAAKKAAKGRDHDEEEEQQPPVESPIKQEDSYSLACDSTRIPKKKRSDSLPSSIYPDFNYERFDVPYSPESMAPLLLAGGGGDHNRDGHKNPSMFSSSSIFLGGLHFNTDEETLRWHFGKYGEITAVEIMRNAAGTPRGFGFVEFLSDDSVEAALQNKPHVIHGRAIDVKRKQGKGSNSGPPPGRRSPPPLDHREVKRPRLSEGAGYPTRDIDVYDDRGRESFSAAPPPPGNYPPAIFLGGLHFNTTESNLREHFEKYGEITSVDIKRDPATGDPRGFGFVNFRSHDAVDLVIREKPHKVHGHNLDVKRKMPKGVQPPASDEHYDRPPAREYAEPERRGYDDRRGDEDMRHPEPARSYRSNSFNNDPSADACKLFIGGLFWQTTKDKIGQYFERFGDIMSVEIMMDSKTGNSRGCAIVEFRSDESVEEALRAKPHEIDYKYVDVRRYQAGAPPESYREREEHAPYGDERRPPEPPAKAGPNPECEIFVGGLHWETTEDEFRSYFERYGEVVSVQIKRDRNTGNPRGFGFVVMRTEEMVDLLMRDNREHKLHNHNITVRKAVTNGVPTNQQKPAAYAEEKPAYHHQEEQHYDDYSTGDLPPRDSYQRKESSIESAKLFVGGLSWESTEEIIGRYFDRFGDVASVRIMRHPSTGVARGFAFVEFKNDDTVDIVLQNKPHEIDKKIVDVKRAAAKGVPVPREREIPREREVYREREISREREIPREREVYREREDYARKPAAPATNPGCEIFVGGLHWETTEQEFRSHFEKFGDVVSVQIKRDKVTGDPRGFGFVVMRSEAVVDLLLRDTQPHVLHHHEVTLKRSMTDGPPNNASLGKPEYAEERPVYHDEQQHYDERPAPAYHEDEQHYAEQPPYQEEHYEYQPSYDPEERERRWAPPSPSLDLSLPPEHRLPPEAVELLDYHCYDRRRFIPCKFGSNCRVVDCAYSHEDAPKSDGDAATVFVGGLHFATTEEKLRHVFSEYGEILEVKLMRHQHSGNSRGFGFIVFKTTEVANSVLNKRHFVIDDKDIEVKEYGEKPQPASAEDRCPPVPTEPKPHLSAGGYDRRSDMPCRYGPECRKTGCPYNHQDPAQGDPNWEVKKEAMVSRFEGPQR